MIHRRTCSSKINFSKFHPEPAHLTTFYNASSSHDVLSRQDLRYTFLGKYAVAYFFELLYHLRFCHSEPFFGDL